jgi:transposase
MGNYLKMADVQRIKALLELGWSHRRMQRETGVHRETVARYDPRHSKPAKVTAGSGSKPARAAPGNAAEPYRKGIEEAVARGLTAQRIWQDLKEDYCFGYSYSCIKRFVRGIKRAHPEVADVLEHPPGKEAQVDFFQGPPTLDPRSGC